MKIIARVDNEKCRRYFFRPVQEDLMSIQYFRRISLTGGARKEQFAEIGDIPGQEIVIDIPGLESGDPKQFGYERATGTIRSAISDELWAKIVKLHEIAPREIGSKPGNRHLEENFRLDSEDLLATWLYWVKRGVESKKLTLVEGRLPSLVDCQKIGCVMTAGDTMGMEPRPDKPPLDHLPKLDRNTGKPILATA